MSFDIYGNDLRRGHCEVHPHVHQEYPCELCLSHDALHDISKNQQAEYDRYCNEQANDYYAQLWGDEEYNSWFKAMTADNKERE